MLASDGLWDTLKNEEVGSLILPFYEKTNPEGAVQKLMEVARNRWIERGPNVDDITVIIIFLRHLTSNT